MNEIKIAYLQQINEYMRNNAKGFSKIAQEMNQNFVILFNQPIIVKALLSYWISVKLYVIDVHWFWLNLYSLISIKTKPNLAQVVCTKVYF